MRRTDADKDPGIGHSDRHHRVLIALNALPAGLFQWLKRVPVTRTIGRRLLDVSHLSEDFVDTKILRGPLTGSTIRLQPRTHKEMVIGVYERHLVEPITGALRDGYLAFDIGAHIGYFSLMMARCVGRGGRVVAFEPDPDVMRILLRNTEMNSIGDAIVVVESALSESNGQARFRKGSDSSTGHLSSDGQGLPVKVMTLDAAASVYGTPQFAKVDVEGSEFDVLRSGENLLRGQKTVFLIEAHSIELAERCQKLLGKFHYRCQLLRPRRVETMHVWARPESVV